MSGIPVTERGLSTFVNKIIAPREVAALRTVRLVESIHEIDVVKVVEALEGNSGPRLETEAEKSESETEVDLEVPLPAGG